MSDLSIPPPIPHVPKEKGPEKTKKGKAFDATGTIITKQLVALVRSGTAIVPQKPISFPEEEKSSALSFEEIQSDIRAVYLEGQSTPTAASVINFITHTDPSEWIEEFREEFQKQPQDVQQRIQKVLADAGIDTLKKFNGEMLARFLITGKRL